MSINPNVTMQQKRGLKANLPASAPAGQLLIATDTKELFFGTGSGREQIGSDTYLARTRYVSLTGSDSTGNGSLNKPYATISAALNTITDASPTNRYVIRVAPGQYSEASTVSLKANVYIVGDHYQAVRYNASFQLDNTTFAPNNDNRAGMSQMMISGFTGNFNAALSNQGKVYFEDVTFISSVTVTSYVNGNQFFLDGCQVFGAFTLDGMNSRIVNTQFESTFTMNQATSANTSSSSAVVSGCYLGSSLTVNAASKSTQLFLFNSQVISSATINGASASVTATAESLPNKANIILQNGGNFFRSDDAFSIAYTPAVAGNWSSTPTNVLDAIDTLAAAATTRVVPITNASTIWNVTHNLNKYPSVTTIDSSGNTIYGDVQYTSLNALSISFSAALQGSVYLN